MRVLMLIWNYWPGPEGGAERQCRRQARALAERGVACTVLTHRTKFQAPRRELDGPVEIRRFGLLGPVVHELFVHRHTLRPRAAAAASPTAGGTQPERAPSRAWQVFRWLRRLDYLLFIWSASRFYRRHRGHFDILHVHGACWMPGWARWLVGNQAVPVISKETTTPALKPFDADVPFRARWEARRREALFIATHPGMATELQQAGVPPGRIRLIPNGVDIPSQATDVARCRDALFIGNFTQGARQKGFDVLFAAWKIVAAQEPAARLHVLGGGPAGEWQQWVDAQGLRDRVQFHGFVPDPTPFYLQAAVFLLPSRIEGISNALLEAQSRGVPAVVSDIPGNVAVVLDGVTGLVCPVNDAEALARHTLALLKDAALRSRLGSAAREHVTRHFGMTGVADQLQGLYAELRTGASRPASG